MQRARPPLSKLGVEQVARWACCDELLWLLRQRGRGGSAYSFPTQRPGEVQRARYLRLLTASRPTSSRAREMARSAVGVGGCVIGGGGGCTARKRLRTELVGVGAAAGACKGRRMPW
jgi:hypothetical protein